MSSLTMTKSHYVNWRFTFYINVKNGWGMSRSRVMWNNSPLPHAAQFWHRNHLDSSLLQQVWSTPVFPNHFLQRPWNIKLTWNIMYMKILAAKSWTYFLFKKRFEYDLFWIWKKFIGVTPKVLRIFLQKSVFWLFTSIWTVFIWKCLKID